jgi:hypothetical protein
MGPQDIVALRLRVSGHDVAGFHPLIDYGLAPGRITQVHEVLMNVIFSGLEVLRTEDAALP